MPDTLDGASAGGRDGGFGSGIGAAGGILEAVAGRRRHRDSVWVGKV